MRSAFARASVALRRPGARSQSTVLLMRHGESTWNLENKFTGWYDCPLSDKGHVEAADAGALVAEAGLAFDGLDKQQTVDKHGLDQVTIWRRSYDIPPPDLDTTSPMYPANDPKYAALDANCMPTTESLATTAARVIPYWQQVIVPELKAGKSVIIAAHGNSLHALVHASAKNQEARVL
ncbi:hypothetical protein JL720_1476 [Aureococcus anophagefferens]|nr:hypothetical protein JL720_1476 [Aureococcus anophagefferens]